MSERISIVNFAGLEKINIEFKRFNVFIGPQASGKSITIKLAFFFKNMLSEFIDNISNEENLNTFKSNQVDKFIKFFPKESWKSGDFYVDYYLCDSISIRIKRDGDKKPKIEFSRDLTSAINRTKRYYKILLRRSTKDSKDDILFSRRRERENKLINEFIKNISNESNIFYGSQFFIPAGRSFFSNLQDSIFSFLKDNTILDPFLIEFGSNYEFFKNIFYRHEKNEKNSADEIIVSILNSEYQRKKNIDTLLHKDKRIVNLSNASSGQQEILPLLIILRILLGDRIHFRPGDSTTLYIEEPEAHLFPNAQKAIIRLLAKLCNTKKYQIFITTHSPYLLSSINNHFIAGTIDDDNVYKIIEKDEILHASESTSYVLKNGQAHNLISEEDGLIEADVLDKVSNDIANEFDRLLDMKYGDNE